MFPLSKHSDIELFDLLKSGCHDAYKEIYNRYQAVLYIHAYKRLQDREECRDIIQDLFTNLWLKKDELQCDSNLSGYLYAAVRNKIFDLLSKSKLKTSYLSSLQEFSITGHVNTDYLARQNQLKAIIDQEIAALPPRTKEIFELSRKGYMSHREIAQQLDISEQTVKTTVNNALKVLRIKLGTMFFLL